MNPLKVPHVLMNACALTVAFAIEPTHTISPFVSQLAWQHLTGRVGHNNNLSKWKYTHTKSPTDAPKKTQPISPSHW